MLLRPLRTSLVILAAAFGLGVAACGNISLSAGASSNGNVPATLNQDDAGVVDGGFPANGDGPPADADASVGAVPSTVGSSLCNYNYGGAHVCQPDDSAQCAAVDAGEEDGGEYADAGTLACHVVQTSGDGVSQACIAPGTGGDGAQCEKGTDCAPSYECVGSPGECRHYCCNGDVSCATTNAPSFCDVQSVAWSELDAGAVAAATDTYKVPVCIPVAPCTLFSANAAQCQAGQACSIVKDDGTTSCVAVGPVPLGGSCEADHCQANLACLGTPGMRACYQLCRVDTPTDCPASMTCTSSAQLFSSAAYGLCQ